MYFNDIHIAYYAVAAIIGLIVGQLVSWTNKRLPEYKSVISKDIITEYRINFKPDYILMLLTSVIYVTLIYRNAYCKFRFNQIFNINTNATICICD